MRSGVSGVPPIPDERLPLPFSRAAALRLSYAAGTALMVHSFGFSWLGLGLPTAAFLLLLADGILRPGSGLIHPVVTHGPRSVRQVALSFDDGPDPQVTPAVLDALARHQVRATFFAIGQSLVAHPQLARRIVTEGHELGNHSWQHSRWHGFFSARRHASEIRRAAQAIGELTGDMRAPLFRPPLGMKSPPMARAARSQSLTMVLWSLHSRDTRLSSPQQIAARVLRNVCPGDIILMHDGHDIAGQQRAATAEAVSLILQGLRERELQCVTVSELLRCREQPLVELPH
jgi:peptidoglycan/xylan/chitin deacetylase (PgdA/CDA1 family)